MKLHPKVTRRAPRLGFVTDVETSRKAAEEGGEYRYERISLGYFACIHGENVYIIEATEKTYGCSCPAMTHGKTHSDACKHIIRFAGLNREETPLASEHIKKMLRWEGWIGETTLIPPAEYTQTPKKKKLPPIHDPARKPVPAAATRADKHHKYESMTVEQIVAGMDNRELAKNASKGGIAAKAEQERRAEKEVSG